MGRNILKLQQERNLDNRYKRKGKKSLLRIFCSSEAENVTHLQNKVPYSQGKLA